MRRATGRDLGFSVAALALLIAAFTSARDAEAAAVWWTHPGVNAIAVDPGNPDVLWAATGTRGAFRSADGGETWSRADGIPDAVAHVRFEPGSSRTLWAIAVDGVYRSADGGAAWRRVEESALPLGGIAANGKGAVLLAGTEGISRSEDGGASWRVVHGGDDAYAFDVVFDALQPQRAYGMVTPSFTSGADPDDMTLVASGDGGLRWKVVQRGFIDDVVARGGRLLVVTRTDVRTSDDGGATFATLPAPAGSNVVSIDPRRPRVLYAAAYDKVNAVFMSADGGATWKELFRFPAIVNAMVRTPRGLYVAAGDRLLLAQDDGTFEIIGRDLTTALRSGP